MSGWSRGLAPAVDSLLLVAGCLSWWMRPLNPTLAYPALERGPMLTNGVLCYWAALAAVGFMTSIALAYHPLSLFAI